MGQIVFENCCLLWAPAFMLAHCEACRLAVLTPPCLPCRFLQRLLRMKPASYAEARKAAEAGWGVEASEDLAMGR